MEFEFGKEPFDRDMTLVSDDFIYKMASEFKELYPYRESESNTAVRKEIALTSEELWREYQLKTDSRRTISKLPHPDEMINEMSCSFSCKVCEPPMYLCAEGHLICRKDLDILPSCSYVENGEVCHAKFTSARPLFYEMLYYNSLIECVHKKHGCKELILGKEKAAHEKSCSFQKKKESEIDSTSPSKTPLKEREDSYLEAEEENKFEMRDDSNNVEAQEASKVNAEGKSDLEARQKIKNNEELMSDYRFDEEDVSFAMSKLEENLEQRKWILQIPSVRARNIPLEVAERELYWLKQTIKKVEEEQNVKGKVKQKKTVTFAID